MKKPFAIIALIAVSAFVALASVPLLAPILKDMLRKPMTTVPEIKAALPRSLPTPLPTPYWKSEVWQIETKALALAPGQNWAQPLWVNPEWRNARLVGRFRAQGGSHNDIEALVTDQDGLINWRNNQQYRPKVWYQSGRVTVDTINAPLPKGHSYFTFDNRFSTFSSKAITFDLKIDYERLVYP